MATATRTVNKANFETGDQPTEANFSTLIEQLELKSPLEVLVEVHLQQGLLMCSTQELMGELF